MKPACSTRTPPAPCSAVADEAGARLALLGDRHQLASVGRGGVLDLAAAQVDPAAHLTLAMRRGDNPGAVFDALASVLLAAGE